jgi:hypothetical protein
LANSSADRQLEQLIFRKPGAERTLNVGIGYAVCMQPNLFKQLTQLPRFTCTVERCVTLRVTTVPATV